jgi:hypothetical protein
VGVTICFSISITHCLLRFYCLCSLSCSLHHRGSDGDAERSQPLCFLFLEFARLFFDDTFSVVYLALDGFFLVCGDFPRQVILKNRLVSVHPVNGQGKSLPVGVQIVSVDNAPSRADRHVDFASTSSLDCYFSPARAQGCQRTAWSSNLICSTCRTARSFANFSSRYFSSSALRWCAFACCRRSISCRFFCCELVVV